MTAFEDLNLLRAFIAIVDCGSISAGARSLGLSQPALSRQLRTLEERSGMALLRRDTHQMSLTEGGIRLLEDARVLLTQAVAADLRLREQHTTLTGHLRLFATVDCGQFGVTRLISHFLHDHPQMTASLSLSNRPLHMIQEGADVGVLPGRITDESVVARKAGSIALQLVAAPALVKKRPALKTPADLAAWPWLALAGSQFWGVRELTLQGPKGNSHTHSFTPVFTSEGVTSLREAARCALGLTLLPTWLIEDDLRAGTLVRVLPQWKVADLPVHVIYAGHRLLPLRVSAFIDYAVKHLSRVGDCGWGIGRE
ncbi:DNA-binding transcriptional regulator, LysR family [Prosthecobacter debontii]|uniref:DNA-binding transcriptional regulator, LysR family n=1 Tax=Prosthecobacter debontii TaxID=48467 RepID=A0A1T4XLB6_9BACT|nr:LysR family transcriptional regulator [Prosthecobacter debontii]SKA90362.1 DNA-binding transcriptional regulator, LysR family [Prosthecobacter debontii]